MVENIIYVLGIGNNTMTIVELAELNNFKIAGFYHYNDEYNTSIINGIKVLGTYEDLFKSDNLENKYFALSMGDNKIREEIYEKLLMKGAKVPTLIHPSAIISKYSKIADGVIIQANSTIQADVSVDENTVISFNCGITHSTSISKHCYIAGQSIIGAYIIINEGAFIGMGSVLVSAKVKTVGKWSIIGAGSVVIKPVDDFEIVYGNPAKAKQ